MPASYGPKEGLEAHPGCDSKGSPCKVDYLSQKTGKPCRGCISSSALVLCITFTLLYWGAPRQALALQLGASTGQGQDQPGMLASAPCVLLVATQTGSTVSQGRHQQDVLICMLQEKMKDSQRQLEEMAKRMAKLAQEKSELQSRNRILEHVVRLNVDHVEELSSNQVRRSNHTSSLKCSHREWQNLFSLICSSPVSMVRVVAACLQGVVSSIHAWLGQAIKADFQKSLRLVCKSLQL